MDRETPPLSPKYELKETRDTGGLTRVTVVDFDMSFGHLVIFFVKAAIAAIPAAIILALLAAILVATLGALFGIGRLR